MRNIPYLLLLVFFPALLLAQDNTTFNSGKRALMKEMNVLLDSSEYYYKSADYPNSLRINLKLLETALVSEDPIYINKGYRYLGYDYIAINDTIKAMESFKNAKKYATVLENYTAIGNAYMDIANLNTINGNYKKAYKNHDKSIELFKKAKDTHLIVKGLYNSYVTAFTENDFDKMRFYLKKADQEKYHPYIDDKLGTGFKLYWADYYVKKKRYNIAIKYAEETIELAKKYNYYLELADAYKLLSEIHSLAGDYEKAYKTRLLYDEAHHKIDQQNKNKESQLLEAQFSLEYYQKETNAAREKSILQEQIAAKNTLFNYFLLGICFISFLVLFIAFRAIKKTKQLNKALEVKNKEYLKAKEKSENLSKVKTQFFSTVSHELRTPLYGVIGLSTILLEDENLKDYNRDLTSLKFSADYLLALINDVLLLNKIDSKTLLKENKTFNIRELICNIVSSFEYIKTQNKNNINIDIDTEIPQFLKGNVVQLSQVLMNLIGNACKFTENGDINICLKNEKIEDDTISIEFVIKDTGIGISKEKQEAIFDEFTQIEQMDYTYQGTGLGLPIVKKLIKLSNSEIFLESDIGKGSKFTFVLEYTIVKDVATKIKTPGINTIALENKKILVAEDNRINQIVTKKMLEKMGVICTLANNGKEAVDLVNVNKFDLVLMDLNMPIMDGFDATLDIKKINKKLPVVALTAVEVEEVRNKIKDVGMNGIIVKPYNTNKFKQVILENIN